MTTNTQLLRKYMQEERRTREEDIAICQGRIKQGLSLRERLFSSEEAESQNFDLQEWVEENKSASGFKQEDDLARQLFFANLNQNIDLFWLLKYSIANSFHYDLQNIYVPAGWGRDLYPTKGRLVTFGWNGGSFIAYDFVLKEINEEGK